jgi:prepilin-type N-terminal cleavage/methylation domain-containing protein
MRHHDAGFTLVEIAIVLVIIGLLLSSVIKGQELIQSARVRNLIALQDSVKAAFFGFQDRYHALPGDYASASTNMSCPTNPCLNGNGNGLIEVSATPVSGSVQAEYLLSWTHLSAAGFLNYSFQMQAADTDADEANSPQSPFLELAHDGWYGAGQSGFTLTGSGPNPARHNFKFGNNIPVEILAEVDRKVDDGLPYSGSLQFSMYAPASSTPPTAISGSTGCILLQIISGKIKLYWNRTGKNSNCGAASLL